MVRKAAKLEIEIHREGNTFIVDASVGNVSADHPIPGGATLRNIILLLVETRDAEDYLLTHTDDKHEKLPLLAAKGKAAGDYAGRSGRMFARPFVSKTAMVPAGGFNADHILFDTRIWPGDTDHSEYHFKADQPGLVSVKVSLIYRWAFKPLVDKKGWQ